MTANFIQGFKIVIEKYREKFVNAKIMLNFKFASDVSALVKTGALF